MHICPLANPPAFKLWTRELTEGPSPGGQLHALVLVGASAEALVNCIYTPDWLREPYIKRRTYSQYSESMGSESELPRGVHLMLVTVPTHAAWMYWPETAS